MSLDSTLAVPALRTDTTGLAPDSGQLYLAFMLCGEQFAIDILRIREIIEYTQPTAVPMMPQSVRGVINLRGAVVPVIDLAVRFRHAPTAIARRTCIVIVEVEHEERLHVLGLLVDRVNAVMEIRQQDIEPPPAFGAHIDTDFIAGMGRVDGRFVIVLNIGTALSLQEMAAVAHINADAADDAVPGVLQ